MGLTFDTTIGRQMNNTIKATTTQEKRDPAVYWINIGYSQLVDVDGGTEERFITLAAGIPLDTMAVLETKGSNELFRQMQSARNDLRDQLLALAHTLVAGEEKSLGILDCGLEIRIRRVNEAKPEIKAVDNPFTKRLNFAAAA